MNGFKDIVKGGWHPERNSSSSGSGDGGRLGKVKGLMGKGGGGEAREDPHTHQSAPLSTLVDPASFGPPPKHIHYHGAAAAQGSRPPPPPPAPRRLQQGQAAPTSGEKPKPSLPPRLPPRQNSNPHEYTPEPPPSYSETTNPLQGELNQGALHRLGQAGVSVPAFGIGRTASPPVPPRQTASPVAQSPVTDASQMGELQSRFSRMSTPTSQPSATGTTWAQKQAALKTAGNLRDDPSKVSLSDMRSAASTANNFRERHGEQAAAGWKKANGLNQKYGITNKVNSFAASSSTSPPPQSPTTGGFKKPPPPPPPKKKELGDGSGEPPPIPLSSKPKF